MSAMGSSGEEVVVHTTTSGARPLSRGNRASGRGDWRFTTRSPDRERGATPSTLARSAGLRGRLRTESWQRRLIPHDLDTFQLGLDTIERRRRVVVFVARIGEVLADDVEDIPELVDVAPQSGEPALDLTGVLLDLQPAQAEHDYLEVGVKRVRRDGNDVAPDGVGGR